MAKAQEGTAPAKKEPNPFDPGDNNEALGQNVSTRGLSADDVHKDAGKPTES